MTPSTDLCVSEKGASESHTHCLHCNLPLLEEKPAEQAFCCAGCAYVFKFLSQENLGKFYQLDTITKPVFSEGKLSVEMEHWLTEKEKSYSSASQTSQQVALQISGVSCAACVWLIEKVFKKETGALHIEVSPQQGLMRCTIDVSTFPLRDFIWQVTRLGYKFSPLSNKEQKLMHSKRLLPKIGMAAMFMLHTMLFSFPHYLGLELGSELGRLFHILAFAFSTFSFLLGATTFFGRAIRALQQKMVHMDLPISLGIFTAYLGCLVGFLGNIPQLMYFDFISTFIFLMLVGRYFQEYTIERNQNQVIDYDLSVQLVQRAANEAEECIPVSALEKDDPYTVEGQTWIPVRSRLLSESIEISLESLHGEPETKVVSAGGIIPSGAKHVGHGKVRLLALEKWGNSRLATLASLEEKENSFSEKSQRTLKWYLGIVLLCAVGGLGFWLLKTSDLLFSFQVFVSVLVISCPCALGVSIPMIHQIGISRLKQAGIFVKHSNLWQKINQVRAILFDKTGTLTLEYPILRNPESLRALSAEDKKILYSMTQQSLHPVCLSVQEAILPLLKDIATVPLTVMENVGSGIQVQWEEYWYELKKSRQQTEAGIESSFYKDGQLLATFYFEECLRKGSQHALHYFKERGFDLYILSGDKMSNVQKTAQHLGISLEKAQGGMSPQDKASFVKNCQDRFPLMLGDGLNDRLAFANAYCKGTPFRGQSILEKAVDFYYTTRDMHGIIELFRVARRYQQTLRAIFGFAIAYNVIAIFLCLIGYVNPLVAAVLMPLSALASLLIGKVGMSTNFHPVIKKL